MHLPIRELQKKGIPHIHALWYTINFELSGIPFSDQEKVYQLHRSRMSMSDPIGEDPVLLYTWTRIVIVLIGLLAFAVGYEADVSIPMIAG